MIGKPELFPAVALDSPALAVHLAGVLTGARSAAEIAIRRDPSNLMQVMLPQGVTDELPATTRLPRFRSVLRVGAIPLGPCFGSRTSPFSISGSAHNRIP